MDWTGFSDDDLRRLKKSTDGDHQFGDNKPKPAELKRNVRPRKSVKPVDVQSSTDIPVVETLSSNQKLAHTRQPRIQQHAEVTTAEKLLSSKPEIITSKVDSSSSVKSQKISEDKKVDVKSVENTEITPDLSVAPIVEQNVELDEQTIFTKELANLDKFREQQKMMEELNKRKKQMLTDAIKQRQSRAKVEAAKLTHIKRELDRLDQLVNTDVSLIRDKIEAASREYLEAQKRYSRAEKEFIDAKTDLHEKSETKDLLTEHLYTVIHQNEMRKAKKLAELMERLELETSDGDGDALDVISPAPVPLCLIAPLNQLGIHGPGSPNSHYDSSHLEIAASPIAEANSSSQVPAANEIVVEHVQPDLDAQNVKNDSIATMSCDAHGIPGKETANGTV